MPAIPNFNFTEWWKIAEGEKLNKPFHVGDELATGLLHALKMVSTLVCYAVYRPFNEPGLQRQTSAELRARTIHNFKEASEKQQDIETTIEYIKWILESRCQSLNEKADRLDNLHTM